MYTQGTSQAIDKVCSMLAGWCFCLALENKPHQFQMEAVGVGLAKSGFQHTQAGSRCLGCAYLGIGQAWHR